MSKKSKPEIKMIPLDQIHAPSEFLDWGASEQEDRQLLKSIKELGILSPLVVMPENEHSFCIVDGFRRYQAAQKLGFRDVLCSISRPLSKGKYEILRFELNTKCKP